jgi:NADPH2:quinone reductase
MAFSEYGGPEVLHKTERPAAEPADGEVTIDIAWAGVNFADVLARRSGYRVPALPFVPGLEVAGHVRAVGPGVTHLHRGQRVAALLPGGGYADAVTVPASAVFPVPDGVSLRTAAVLPTVLPAAYGLVHEVARVRADDRVLVHSAAGGMGTAIAQLAKGAGATVYGTVSRDDKRAYALAHGCDQVFLDAELPGALERATGGSGVDVVFDAVGGDTWRQAFGLLAPFGRLVSYGNASGADPWHVEFADLGPGSLSVSGFSILSLLHSDPDRVRDLARRALEAVTAGDLVLPVTAEHALEDAAEAHRLLEARTTTGKLVLRVSGDV